MSTIKKICLTVPQSMNWLIVAIVSISLSVNLAADTVEQTIANKLKTINASVEIDSLQQSPWPGMYEITLKTGEVLFSDENAEYLMIGQMYNLSAENGFVNLSEKKNQAKVAKELNAYPVDLQIVYAAKGQQQAQITVFTDISCYYCQKLHKAIPALQKKGVTVKYMAFPRAGIGSDIAQKMEAVWCAKDPAKAMSIAKAQGSVSSAKCENPVSDQFRLAHKLGVNATPTIFTEKGLKIAGFASTENLLVELGVIQ